MTKVHQAIAPQLLKHLPGQKSQDTLIRETVDQIDSSGLFGKVLVKEYPWSEEYTAERLIKLLNSFALICNLDKEVRRKLLAGIQEVVEQFGGVVESQNISLLYMARVKR